MQIALKPNAMYEYRTEVGISRDELSRRMGIATTTAYRVENGATPSTRFVAEFIKITGAKFEDLFILVEDSAA